MSAGSPSPQPSPLGRGSQASAAIQRGASDLRGGVAGSSLSPRERAGMRRKERFTLQGASPKQLVAALKNDNMFWRMHAQRLLVERGNTDVVPALCELVRDAKVDEIGLNTAAIHALWTLHGLKAIESDRNAAAAGISALKHPSAGVRRAAVMVLPRSESSFQNLQEAKLLDDSDAQVRMAAQLQPVVPAFQALRLF